MYTDSEILDLYEDLQSIGAAETLVERAMGIFDGLQEGTPLRDASKLLTSKGIPHTFYTRSYLDIVLDKKGISNWILVKGQTVFFEEAYYSTPAVKPRTIEEIRLDSMLIGDRKFISDAQYSNINSLPFPCYQIKKS